MLFVYNLKNKKKEKRLRKIILGSIAAAFLTISSLESSPLPTDKNSSLEVDSNTTATVAPVIVEPKITDIDNIVYSRKTLALKLRKIREDALAMKDDSFNKEQFKSDISEIISNLEH